MVLQYSALLIKICSKNMIGELFKLFYLAALGFIGWSCLFRILEKERTFPMKLLIASVLSALLFILTTSFQTGNMQTRIVLSFTVFIAAASVPITSNIRNSKLKLIVYMTFQCIILLVFSYCCLSISQSFDTKSCLIILLVLFFKKSAALWSKLY